MKDVFYLRFGVLCNSIQLQLWQVKVINHLLEAGHQLVLVVMPASSQFSADSRFKKWVKYPYRKLLFRLYFRYILKPEAKRLIDGSPLFVGARIVKDNGHLLKNFYIFNENTIEAIKQSGAHFLLRFGFGLIKGEILSITPYGVWSFHHDDPEVVRGVPSNFWEIYEGIPYNGAILQKLSDKIDSGPILRKGWFSTLFHSWEGNINQAYLGSVSWPSIVCSDIICNGDQILSQAMLPKPGKLYLAPDNLIFLKFLIKLGYNRLRYHLKELFEAEQWIIGYAQADPADLMHDKINPTDFTWIKNHQHNEYRADPAGWFDGKKLRFFFEYYNYCKPRGVLHTITAQGSSKLQTNQAESIALKADMHLAFPFVFDHQNKLYCIPETSDNNRIELYDWDETSQKFNLSCTLIENLRAVDVVAFRHTDYWWLFFTSKDRSNYELHAWYSSELTGPYKPHALNPIKTDARSARPAGAVFYFQGKLIRPAQNCVPYSGRSIVLNEIEDLSPTTFRETMIKEILPTWNPKFKDGIHTLNFAGPFLIVDAKRHGFVLCNFKNKLLEKIKKISLRF